MSDTIISDTATATAMATATATATAAEMEVDITIEEELQQLKEQTAQIQKQFQEAEDAMNRIVAELDAKVGLSIDGKPLESVLKTLHTSAMDHIGKTGTNPFGELLLAVLESSIIA